MTTVNIAWSSEDEGYIAVDMTRPGCCAFGKTRAEAMRELADAQAAWDEARQKLTECKCPKIVTVPRPDLGRGYFEVRVDDGRPVVVLTSPREFAFRDYEQRSDRK